MLNHAGRPLNSNPRSGPRSRSYCLTVNNPDTTRGEDGVPVWAVSKVRAHDHLVGIYFQLEEGTDGKTPHYQGLVQFRNPIGLAGARKVFPRGHLEQRKGTFQQAKEYCGKDETRVAGPWEVPDGWTSDIGNQGKRSDLDRIAELVSAGKSYPEIFGELGGAAIRYASHIEKARGLLDVPRVRVHGVDVVLFWGSTGCGKSHSAYAPWVDGEALSPQVYRVCHPTWMDGYTDQKVLIIDDTDWLQWPIGSVLQVLDKWPVQRQRKGSSVWGKWTHVVICHNQHPAEWCYKGAREDYRGGSQEQVRAVERRIENIVHFDGPNWQEATVRVQKGSWDSLHEAYQDFRPANLQDVGDDEEA